MYIYIYIYIYIYYVGSRTNAHTQTQTTIGINTFKPICSLWNHFSFSISPRFPAQFLINSCFLSLPSRSLSLSHSLSLSLPPSLPFILSLYLSRARSLSRTHTSTRTHGPQMRLRPWPNSSPLPPFLRLLVLSIIWYQGHPHFEKRSQTAYMAANIRALNCFFCVASLSITQHH